MEKKKKKPHYGFFSSQNWLDKEEKERKQKLSFRSVPFLPDGKYKIPKKEKKIKKINKYHCGFISCQNRLVNAEKEKK